MVMLSNEVLELLICPESKQSLSQLGDEELSAINEQISKKELKTTAGSEVIHKLEAALIREDKKVVFPIRSEIPVLLFEEAIQLA